MSQFLLGLPLSSDQFLGVGTGITADDRFFNHRRQILRRYPNGGCPLTGLLSIIPSEPTNDSLMIWYEKEYRIPYTTTRGTNPATLTAPADGDSDTGTIVSGTLAVSTPVYIKVATIVDMRPGVVIQVGASNSQFIVQTVVKGVADPSLKGYVLTNPLRQIVIGGSAGQVPTTDFTAGTQVRVLGTAIGEGQSGTGITPLGFKRPYPCQNTTQIFRTPAQFSGSVLQMGLKYDQTGPYRERMKDCVIEHMEGIEQQLIWGKRASTSRPSFDASQEDLNTRSFSGIYEWLQLWDAGSTGITIDGSTYAPFAWRAAVTGDTDDNARIITNASGVVTVDLWNIWSERISRYHTNNSNEKLVLCGPGAILAMHKLFRMNSTYKVEYGVDAYGLSFTTLLTPHGKFHFVQHPAFADDPTQRYWALIVDVWSMKLRPLTGRDTKLLKNRQNNGDDFRKDEFLSELGLEFNHVRNNMLIKNVQYYSES